MRTISVKDARANFSELLGSIYYTREPILVERKGKPFAVVMNPDEYERFRQQEEKDWAMINEIRMLNADRSPDEVLKDVTKTVETVRKQLYEKEKRSKKRSR